MRYRIAQLLRRLADRVDKGLHRAFEEAQHAADIYDALQKAEDERRPAHVPTFVSAPDVSPDDLMRLIRLNRRRGAQ